MRISYSILWFDDNQDYLDSLDLDDLNDTITSWGFVPQITLVSNPDEFMQHAPFKEFDLVAMDYNLEEFGEHGQTFIKKIRNHDVYTEVVFYSANKVSDLWKAIEKEKLEGIFVASRTHQGEITKILKVAKQSIQKVLDLENVRGIVMAEVGNIDEQLELIALKLHSPLSEKKQLKVMNKYIDKIATQNYEVLEAVEKLRDTVDISLLIRFLDSSKKWNICQSLSKETPEFNINLIGDYKKDILDPRNFLAHGIPDKQSDASLVFNHNGNEYIFNESKSAELRFKLQYYFKQFGELLQ
jgi:CheY-like chemotaxis protein